MATEITPIKNALRRHDTWYSNGASLREHERYFGLRIEDRILKKIEKGGITRVLFLGSGKNPIALHELSKMLKGKIKKGRLELHATHITAKSEWGAYIKRHKELPVTFYKATIPMIRKKGLKFDIIVDRLGAILFSNDKKNSFIEAKKLLRRNGILVTEMNWIGELRDKWKTKRLNRI
ncbi:hypothetical protein HY989_05005 [Candidatus Micrarchaeota archaeon]|nr:hypothetical protein [Candidatus Micrarchaeota archaeon]